MSDGATIVVDIGKTVSKAGLWQPDGSLIAKRTMVNKKSDFAGYLALDTHTIESWLEETLKDFAQLAAIENIIPVSHGAGAALVNERRLLLPPLDYENPIPRALRREYERLRDRFDETGSPLLPDGLNLGMQLYYLQSIYPDCFRGGAQIVPWAQYWSWLLCGIACTEVTSLGCHTDLWRPAAGAFSALAIARGWVDLMAPMRRAGEVLGQLGSHWQKRTGLPTRTRILCGLHDSNAALLAARGFAPIAGAEATVLSTGTWFVAMRTPRTPIPLSSLVEGRDCVVNIDVHGRMIPSARFMGGREIELLTEIAGPRIDNKHDQAALLTALAPVVERQSMIVPTLVAGTGPFPHSDGQWRWTPDDDFERGAAVGLYAALLADASLDLIGAQSCLLVEGRFAQSETLARSLATLRPDLTVYTASVHSDASYGALRLLDPGLPPPGELCKVEPLPIDLQSYRVRWRAAAEHRVPPAA